jgi:serine/threonine-protein kinase
MMPAWSVAADSQNSDDQTQAGAVLGTFSCMAPEQAHGDIAALDERCDVFGLGAILCTILTGSPPYGGDSADELWRQAREADLGDAWSRLDARGADQDLTQLARACLAPAPADRPANAGRVAEAMTRYLASVQARLQETRVARAQAEVKAQEAGQKRRLAIGLAAAVVTLVVGASLVGWWHVNDQAQRDRDEARRDAESLARARFVNGEVGAALDEAVRLRRDLRQRLGDPRQAAVLMSELHRWQSLLESARAAWQRADTLAAGSRELLTPDLSRRLATTADELQADERERQLAVELDRDRFEASTPIQSRLNMQAALPRLAQAFRKAGFDVEADRPTDVGRRIGASAIRLPLVASLDFWALVTSDPDLRSRCLEAARTADPDPWRGRYREAEGWSDPEHLQTLARSVDPIQQSPQLLAALAQRLRHASVDASGLLRRALVHHPRDFWLFFETGLAARTLPEQIGAYRAAVAVRPDSGIAYYVLGDVHLASKQLAEAIDCYRRSIELVPDYAGAHNNLGLALDEQGNKPAALACFRRAVELAPEGEVGLSNLGGALQQAGQLEEAAVALKKAVDADPKRSSSHSNLAAVLRGLGKLDEAVASLHQAIALNPKNPFAWCNLGHTLTEQGKFAEGLDAMRTGHKLSLSAPDWNYPSAQWVKETEQFLKADQDLQAVLMGEVEPANAQEQLALATICTRNKRRPAAATRFFTAAFQANPLLALPATRHRYSAACAAVRASMGEGIDAADTSAEERLRFRKQARAWLMAELTDWSRLVDILGAAAGDIDPYFKTWQTAPELAGVREPAALAKLPPDEREAWHTLWTKVAALRKRLAKK